jgi:hypothetical protein
MKTDIRALGLVIAGCYPVRRSTWETEILANFRPGLFQKFTMRAYTPRFVCFLQFTS